MKSPATSVPPEAGRQLSSARPDTHGCLRVSECRERAKEEGPCENQQPIRSTIYHCAGTATSRSHFLWKRTSWKCPNGRPFFEGVLSMLACQTSLKTRNGCAG